jgi:hypothetical protein
MDSQIQQARKNLLDSKISELLHAQRQERRAVSEAHKAQMHYFRHLWADYFHRLDQRERQIYHSFSRHQQQEYLQAYQRSKQRCRSHSLSSEIPHLLKTEQLLRKAKDYKRLIQLKG